jgi:hypothetical protein
MQIELSGVFNPSMQIELLNRELLKGLRDAHKSGDVIRVIFDDSVERENDKLFRLFHVYRDQYANKQGLEKEYAKALLKFRYGAGVLPLRPNFKPPVGERGAFLEVEQRIYWLKSTTVYTNEEMGILIEGTVSEINQSA